MSMSTWGWDGRIELLMHVLIVKSTNSLGKRILNLECLAWQRKTEGILI